jgi:tRNA (guanine37-N1)-methyltransferase
MKYPKLPRNKTKHIPQDIIGNIAILKFPRKTLWIIKKIKALKFLKQNKTLTTVLEKTEKISGQLRTPTTKYLAGEKTSIATYRENNCIFKFDVNKSYFSPRLSNERKMIAEEVYKLIPKTPKSQNTKTPAKIYNILVMFAGVAPYPITIAKHLLKANSQKLTANFHIYANELNEEANKEAKQNIILNKLQKQITLLPGDANQLAATGYRLLATNIKLPKFDIILMPRPNLDDTFLKTALKLSKSGTTIFYHGFGTKESVLKEIKKDTKGKIGKIAIRKAGDIGPYIFRWQTQFKAK